jgi:hypothetical protein
MGRPAQRLLNGKFMHGACAHARRERGAAASATTFGGGTRRGETGHNAIEQGWQRWLRCTSWLVHCNQYVDLSTT